jgi:two-component system, NarL family, response regulator LiaR
MPRDTTLEEGEHQPLRAIVADDDPFARRMIKEALQNAGIVVIAEAQNGREAVELTLHYRPDVVLMDLVMPELDGIAATRAILRSAPKQVIVMLTSGNDDEVGLISLRAGAAGFLTKDLEIDALPRVVLGAIRGEAVISRRLSMRLVEHLRRTPAGSKGMRPVQSPLTPREWDVIELMAEGLTTERMAGLLVLSTETVRTHIKNILRKLDARSREEAVAAARSMQGGID